MKILYVVNARIPTEKAHGLQIMKTCEALADLGHHVTLLVPKRINRIKSNAFDYYGVRPNFTLRTVWSLDLVRWGRIGFLIQYATFSLAAALCVNSVAYDLVYGRSELSLLSISFVRRIKPVWEAHEGVWNLVTRLLVERLQLLVVVSAGLQDFYKSKHAAVRIEVIPNGVDVEQFSESETTQEARERLRLPQNKRIALYIGSLDGWKGTTTFWQASQLFDSSIVAVAIGGEPERVQRLSSEYPGVIFLGYRPYRELAGNQAAADVLIIPNTQKDLISSSFTSPLKLFAHMASGKPIVASDLPSIRDVAGDDSAYYVVPDDSKSLAEGIQTVLNNKEIRENLVKNAGNRIRRYSWHARAVQITNLTHDTI